MGDIVCTACINEPSVNINCPECHGLGVKESGFITDQLIPELAAGGLAAGAGYAIHKGIQTVKKLKKDKTVGDEPEEVLEAMDSARHQHEKLKKSAQFNRTDEGEDAPCSTCKDSMFGPKVCPQCGGNPDAVGSCKRCKGSGKCNGCRGTGKNVNFANRNPTTEELYRAARFSTASADGTCTNTRGEQTNRQQCQAPIRKGDIILTASPETAFSTPDETKKEIRRSGFKTTAHCPDCTLDTIRMLADHERTLPDFDEENSQFAWTSQYDDDALENILKVGLKDRRALLGGGHLREVAQGLAVPKKATEASVKSAVEVGLKRKCPNCESDVLPGQDRCPNGECGLTMEEMESATRARLGLGGRYAKLAAEQAEAEKPRKCTKCGMLLLDNGAHDVFDLRPTSCPDPYSPNPELAKN